MCVSALDNKQTYYFNQKQSKISKLNKRKRFKNVFENYVKRIKSKIIVIIMKEQYIIHKS